MSEPRELTAAEALAIVATRMAALIAALEHATLYLEYAYQNARNEKEQFHAREYLGAAQSALAAAKGDA
jgi:hypothetical protein